MNIVAIDIGRSAVKVVGKRGIEKGADEIRFIFPSVVAHAIDISDEATRSRAEKETVTVDGVSYFTGDTAIKQGHGSVMTGLSDDWITSTTHEALLLSSLKRLANKRVPLGAGDMVILGLPSRVHAAQKDTLKQLCARHTQANIMVMPQPIGPYQYEILTEDGEYKSGRSFKKESWAVIDVGHYTTDFMLMIGTDWIESASGSGPGVHIAAEQLVKIMASRQTITVVAAEEALRTGVLMHYGKSIDIQAESRKAVEPVVQGIINEAKAKIAHHVHKLNGVLVAGGGASLVFDGIRQIWPHAKLVGEGDEKLSATSKARMSVADGFLRYGLLYARQKQQKK